MAKFTFVMPDGQLLTLNGPADATQAQAEKIYLQQLSAGALVGLRPGDKLKSTSTAVQQFALGRLERGTAGVDDIPLIAINAGTVISTLPSVGNVSLQNPISTANVVAVTNSAPVGPLTPTQVRSIMAQIAKAVDQPATQISQEKGIGKYGFNAPQLEKSGHLKPGTSCRFLGLKAIPVTPNHPTKESPFMLPPQAQPNPDNFTSVMASPGVWTGKDGVTSLNHVLVNEPLQDNIQQQLISSSYNDLVQTGQIVTSATSTSQPTGTVYASTTSSSGLSTGLAVGLGVGAALLSSGALSNLDKLLPSSGLNVGSLTSSLGGLNVGSLTSSLGGLMNSGTAQLGGLLSAASTFGAGSATAWANGLTPDGLTSQINNLAKQGQFAVNFSDFKLPNAVAGEIPAPAFTGTVNRQTVDAATAKLIGTSKIPTPGFGGTSIDSTFNTSIAGSAGGLLNNVTGGLSSIPGASSILSKTGLPNLGSVTGGLPSISGLPNLTTPGFAGPLNTNALGVNGTGTSSTGITPEIMQARKDAYAEVEATQAALEYAITTYGRGSPEYQAAYAAYQAANSRFQALA